MRVPKKISSVRVQLFLLTLIEKRKQHKHNTMKDFIKVTCTEDSEDGVVWISKYQIIYMVADERHQTYIYCPNKEFKVTENITEILEQIRPDRPEMSKKNKWLYPTDGFGKMETGVEDCESKETIRKE